MQRRLPARIVAAWRRLRRAYVVASRHATGHDSDLPHYEKEGTALGRCLSTASAFGHTLARSRRSSAASYVQRSALSCSSGVSDPAMRASMDLAWVRLASESSMSPAGIEALRRRQQ